MTAEYQIRASAQEQASVEAAAPQTPRPAPEIGGFLRAVATASAAAAAGTLKLPDPAAMASLSAMAGQQPPLGAISMPVCLYIPHRCLRSCVAPANACKPFLVVQALSESMASDLCLADLQAQSTSQHKEFVSVPSRWHMCTRQTRRIGQANP